MPAVTAEAGSAPSLLRRLLLRRRAASVGRLLRRRRASDSHAAATVAAAPAVAVAPATWRLYRGASTPVPPGDAVAGRPRRDRWLLSRAAATSRSALTSASTGSFAAPCKQRRWRDFPSRGRADISPATIRALSELVRRDTAEPHCRSAIPKGAFVVSLDAAGLPSDHERRLGEDPAASALGQGCGNPRSAQCGARWVLRLERCLASALRARLRSSDPMRRVRGRARRVLRRGVRALFCLLASGWRGRWGQRRDRPAAPASRRTRTRSGCYRLGVARGCRCR